MEKGKLAKLQFVSKCFCNSLDSGGKNIVLQNTRMLVAETVNKGLEFDRFYSLVL